MIITLAWRNVWRNKVRSLVVLCAIAIGLFGVIFVAAISTGMIVRLISSNIENEIGDVQVRSSKYGISEDIRDVFHISESEELLYDLSSNLEAFSYRLRTEAMASSANNAIQVMMTGVDTVREPNVSAIADQVVDGQYFGTDTRLKEIVVGRGVLEELKLDLGSKVVLSFANVAGEINYESFRIVGVYKTASSEFDKMNVYVIHDQIAPILKTGEGNFHEIVIRCSDEELDKVWSTLSQGLPGYDVRRWFEVNPNLRAMESMMDLSTYIMVVVVLIALIFGIINTMLMVVMERRKELGMLRALGMIDRKIAAMIMTETIVLSVLGGVLGNAISFAAIKWFGTAGIKFEDTAKGLESFGVGDTIYPALPASTYLTITILVLITALLASIMPVRRAMRQDIADTLRN